MVTPLSPDLLSPLRPEEYPLLSGYLTERQKRSPYDAELEAYFNRRRPEWSYILPLTPVSNQGETLIKQPDIKGICGEYGPTAFLGVLAKELIFLSRPFVMRGEIPMGLKMPFDETERQDFMVAVVNNHEPLMSLCIRFAGHLDYRQQYFDYLGALNQS